MLRLATKHEWASCFATAATAALQQPQPLLSTAAFNRCFATAALQPLLCNSRTVYGDEAVVKGAPLIQPK